jgi:hypothetical protein
MNIRVHAESGDPAGHDLLAYMLLARHAHDRAVSTAALGFSRAVLRRLQGACGWPGHCGRALAASASTAACHGLADSSACLPARAG